MPLTQANSLIQVTVRHSSASTSLEKGRRTLKSISKMVRAWLESGVRARVRAPPRCPRTVETCHAFIHDIRLGGGEPQARWMLKWFSPDTSTPLRSPSWAKKTVSCWRMPRFAQAWCVRETKWWKRRKLFTDIWIACHLMTLYLNDTVFLEPSPPGYHNEVIVWKW